ncbi:unnamed protein product [Amoebophrya sp. A25]|nr:unnamed protein product [Amoebophrya sp. A25]|eukprot:GSA25T00024115001.1
MAAMVSSAAVPLDSSDGGSVGPGVQKGASVTSGQSRACEILDSYFPSGSRARGDAGNGAKKMLVEQDDESPITQAPTTGAGAGEKGVMGLPQKKAADDALDASRADTPRGTRSAATGPFLQQLGATSSGAKGAGRSYSAAIQGVYTFPVAKFDDARGNYVNLSTEMAVLESGTALSHKNVLRGFHCSPFPKVVTCLAGEMFDALLDLRPESPTFGAWQATKLSPELGCSLFLPSGVAHAYLATQDNTLTLYFKGDKYDSATEINVNALDPEIGVSWPIETSEMQISAKDAQLPGLREAIAAHPSLQSRKKCWYAPFKFQAYGEEEIAAVTKCLRDGWLAPGPRTEEFERRVTAYFGKRYGIMVNSGSSANLIGIAMCELPKGSEIITPACTFSTVLAPLEQLSLVPVFVDVELTSYVPTLEDIVAAVTPKTKMIMVPNLIGSKIDWEELRRRLADLGRSDIILFEDSCDTMTHTPASDISAISFYASHIITAGGLGGILMMNSESLLKKAFQYRDWGRVGNNSEDMDERFKDNVDGIEYDGKFLYSVQGYNMKACEMNAAFGLSQFRKLPRFTKIRRENIARFCQNLRAVKGMRYVLPRDDYETQDWLALPLQHPNRSGVIRYLEKRQVQIRVTFAGNVTRHPAYRHHFRVFENADRIMKDGFLIGAHHGLTLEDVDYVSSVLLEFDLQDRQKQGS